MSLYISFFFSKLYFESGIGKIQRGNYTNEQKQKKEVINKKRIYGQPIVYYVWNSGGLFSILTVAVGVGGVMLCCLTNQIKNNAYRRKI